MLSADAVTSSSPTQVRLLTVKRFLKVLRHLKRGVEVYYAMKSSSSQYYTPQSDLSAKAELLSSEEQDIWELLQEFWSVFQDEKPASLPSKRDIIHEIETVPYIRPPHRPLYELSPAELLEAWEHKEKLLHAGTFYPRRSTHGSPFLCQLSGPRVTWSCGL